MITISVIMPVYNGESHVREAIESILNQSYKHFEFIIINDGSRDKSAEIINEYVKKDHRIIFLNRKENKKLPYTLNEGLKSINDFYIALEKQCFLMQSIFEDDHLLTSLFEVVPGLAAELTT